MQAGSREYQVRGIYILNRTVPRDLNFRDFYTDLPSNLEDMERRAIAIGVMLDDSTKVKYKIWRTPGKSINQTILKAKYLSDNELAQAEIAVTLWRDGEAVAEKLARRLVHTDRRISGKKQLVNLFHAFWVFGIIDILTSDDEYKAMSEAE